MIKQDSILIQIQQIICEVLKKDNIEINEETVSEDVDGWDSLTHMAIIAHIEKSFGVVFNFREVIKLKNVGDLCNIILTKMK